jgi:hypothetical protein
MNTIAKKSRSPYVVCVERGNYRVDLQIGKVYRAVRREKNDPADMMRILDDSGEDYLYPGAWFVPIEVTPKAKKALAAAIA